MTGQYRRIPLRPLSGGLNQSRSPFLLGPGETPDCNNVDFDRESVKTVNGSVKFNNQAAPRSGIRTRVDKSLSPLAVSDGQSAPLRGYGYIPYQSIFDIGGDFESMDGGGTVPFNLDHHNARGRDFDIQIGFRMPDETLLYEANARGAAAGSVSAIDDAYGYDEALDEFVTIIQKGGDRLSPMSWALGIVNTGQAFEEQTGEFATDRVTNYALCFVWFDAPAWGVADPNRMMYSLANSADVEATGERCTQALRAFIVDSWIEPGKDYRVSVQLQLDSGSASWSGSSYQTSWSEDGFIKVHVQEGYGSISTHSYDGNTDTADGIWAWKGPGSVAASSVSSSESLEYLCKYGIRYSGRDAVFLGLGYRTAPWTDFGFIPYGTDSAPLERGGFAMLDNSSVPPATAMPGYTLAMTKGIGDSFMDFGAGGLADGTGPAAGAWPAPNGLTETTWSGLGGGSLSFNANALEGYRAVIHPGSNALLQGAVVTMLDYTATGEMAVTPTGWETASTDPVYVRAFRWSQRDMVLSDFRVYASPRDMSNARSAFALTHGLDVRDSSEPDLDLLQAHYPLDDSGGGVLRDALGDNDGYLAPLGLGVSKNGRRGHQQVFLSGEGDALELNLSDNPIFMREFLNALQSGESGFAIEATFRMPEACYAIGGNNNEALLAPWLFSWEVDGDSGLASSTQPILQFGHRCDSEATVGAEPFLWPMGFTAKVPAGSDQSDGGVVTPDGLHSWYRDTGVNYPRWSKTADWAGQSITVQVGVQPGSGPDLFDVYIAATPKGSLNPSSDSTDDAEIAYFASDFSILKRDLARSVITIGGSRNVDNLGYLEMSARMIVDEVRVFAAPAPGALPDVSGGSIVDRSGKLGGARSLPARRLDQSEIREELGDGLSLVNVVEGETDVTSPSRSSFYTGEPGDSEKSIKHMYLQVSGDSFYDLDIESLGEVIPEFYYIDDQADGLSISLATPYAAQTRDAAYAWAFRLVGYTAVGDDLYGRALGGGGALDFDPGATGNDPVRTEDVFYNLAPVSGNWGVRVFAPIEAVDALPSWVSGCMRSKVNPILGLHSVGQTLYAATSGSLFEVDDRWRSETDEGWPKWSLDFKAGAEMLSGSRFPLASDYVRFEPSGYTDIRNTILEPTKDWVFDAIVELYDIGGIQTIAWSGAIDKNPEGTAAAQWWVRLNDGRPEFCVGSTTDFDGAGGTPPSNLFIATGREALPVGERVHVRWQIQNQETASELDEPILYINGRVVESGISHGDSGATYWMRKSTMARAVSLGDEAWVTGDGTGQTILGAAYAFVDVDTESVSYMSGEVRGTLFRPTRHRGWMHSLNGRLSGFVVAREDQVSGFIRGEGFNPYSIEYSTLAFEALNGNELDGIGHRVIETRGTAAQNGTIYSHPFIGIWHQMGLTDEPVSFAQFGNEVFATNGGRVSVIRNRTGSFAGVLPPTSKPRFNVEKKPLWEPNKWELGDGNNDPIDQAAAGADEQVLHYSTYGNNYIGQAHSSELDWDDGDWWCVKLLFRPRSVSGVSQIWGARDSTESGRFILCDDGHLVVGWYDTYLKQNVSIRTSLPVLRSGYVHYIFVRKQWPQGDAVYGNWQNGIYKETGSVADSIVVRRFTKDSSIAYTTAIDAVTDNATPNGISFTTDEDSPSWAVVSGPVSDSTATYSASGSLVTADSGSPFTADMVGMYFQFEDGAGRDGEAFRIQSLFAPNQIVVTTESGGSALLSVSSGTSGRVFSGVSLIKSEGFDDSTSPDSGAYNVEFMGSALQANALNAITPLSGEAWSFGWVVTDQDKMFRDELSPTEDPVTYGTDTFAGAIDTVPPGGLEFDAVGQNHTVVDPRSTAGSTQPNESLEIDLDPLKSVYAGVLTWKEIASSALFTGTRRVRVTFYDPIRNIESNPSPELLVVPAGEDKNNPSGEARYLLTSLPRSVDGKHIHRRIYMSLAGGAELFRVSSVPDNSSTAVSIVKSDQEIVGGALMSFSNGAPPRCSLVGTSQSVMFYGALKGQPDSYIYSLPFQPHRAPIQNFNQVNSGDGEAITGMADLLGKMVIFKRSGIWPTTVKPGIVQQKSISAAGAGCRSHASIVAMEDRLIFLGDRGPMIMKSTGRPMLLAPGLLQYFRDDVDKSWLSRASAAQNVGRSQYVLAIKDADVDYPSRRFSLEYDVDLASEETRAKLPSMHRAARYEDPNITAMGSIDDRRGGSDRMVAGTREGFVVWMDVDGAHTAAMMGYDDIHGLLLPGTSSDNVDVKLEGPMGAKLRWRTGSIENVEQLLFIDDSGVEPVAHVEGDQATVDLDGRYEYAVGALLCNWLSQVVDGGAPDTYKTWRFLDLTRTVGTGTVRLQVYRDLDLTDPMLAEDVDMTLPFRSEALEGVYGRMVQVKFFTRSSEAGQGFEILDMVLRVDDTDPL